MTNSINGALSVLLGMARKSGVKLAPETPTENAGSFPFAIAYDRAGALTDWVAGQMAYAPCTLYLEMHYNRVNLVAAITAAQAARTALLREIIKDPLLGGNVEALLDVRYTFGRLDYGGVETIGYRYELDVKVRLFAQE